LNVIKNRVKYVFVPYIFGTFEEYSLYFIKCF